MAQAWQSGRGWCLLAAGRLVFGRLAVGLWVVGLWVVGPWGNACYAQAYDPYYASPGINLMPTEMGSPRPYAPPSAILPSGPAQGAGREPAMRSGVPPQSAPPLGPIRRSAFPEGAGGGPNQGPTSAPADAPQNPLVGPRARMPRFGASPILGPFRPIGLPSNGQERRAASNDNLASAARLNATPGQGFFTPPFSTPLRGFPRPPVTYWAPRPGASELTRADDWKSLMLEGAGQWNELGNGVMGGPPGVDPLAGVRYRKLRKRSTTKTEDAPRPQDASADAPEHGGDASGVDAETQPSDPSSAAE